MHGPKTPVVYLISLYKQNRCAQREKCFLLSTWTAINKLFLNVILTHFVLFEQSKIVRVLNLWQKNGVFKIEIIQPLLDMAAGTSSAASVTEDSANNEGRECQYACEVLGRDLSH